MRIAVTRPEEDAGPLTATLTAMGHEVVMAPLLTIRPRDGVAIPDLPWQAVAVTSAGHLLAFPVSELPELDKGKGNKLIDIPKAKLGTERVVAIAAVTPKTTLSRSWGRSDSAEGSTSSAGWGITVSVGDLRESENGCSDVVSWVTGG